MTHKDLDVWKKSIELVSKVYQITSHFPQNEVYGLTDQIRRSAVSVPSNIAEGAARQYKKEFIHFLYVALGSIAELETQVIISGNLQYLNDTTINQFDNYLRPIRMMLLGLIKALRK